MTTTRQSCCKTFLWMLYSGMRYGPQLECWERDAWSKLCEGWRLRIQHALFSHPECMHITVLPAPSTCISCVSSRTKTLAGEALAYWDRSSLMQSGVALHLRCNEHGPEWSPVSIREISQPPVLPAHLEIVQTWPHLPLFSIESRTSLV